MIINFMGQPRSTGRWVCRGGKDWSGGKGWGWGGGGRRV